MGLPGPPGDAGGPGPRRDATAGPASARPDAREAGMAIAKTARVHPTAVIDPEADLGEEVQVGPFAVLDGPVRVGNGCVIKAGAHLMGALTLGEGNVVHSYAVLGDDPQHTRFNGESGTIEIGDRNVFREHTTVH